MDLDNNNKPYTHTILDVLITSIRNINMGVRNIYSTHVFSFVNTHLLLLIKKSKNLRLFWEHKWIFINILKCKHLCRNIMCYIIKWIYTDSSCQLFCLFAITTTTMTTNESEVVRDQTRFLCVNMSFLKEKF